MKSGDILRYKYNKYRNLGDHTIKLIRPLDESRWELNTSNKPEEIVILYNHFIRFNYELLKEA